MPTAKTTQESTLAFPAIRGFDYIEIFVGNVRHAEHYYRTVWGFQSVACQGTDAGLPDRTSIVMRQGNIILLLTGAASASSSVAAHLHDHGEGVVTIGLAVDDVTGSYEAAVAGGAKAASEPVVMHDDNGHVGRAEVEALNGFTFAFVDRSDYRGSFLPGFRTLPSSGPPSPIFEDLDHVAIAVETGTLDAWVDFYQQVFGFKVAHKEDVATAKSGMNSKVVQHPLGACKFPLVEPALGKSKSQVQTFLDLHNGPGIQHLAVRTPGIIDTVGRLRDNGVEFLGIPPAYYDQLESRVGSLGKEFIELKDLGILVDHDEWGRLLQVFARSCQDRQTLFFEIIERRGGRGFGGGNIRALFEAMEREQAS
jgi:4-hydroxyphenylpyruvate dioxygenase